MERWFFEYANEAGEAPPSFLSHFLRNSQRTEVTFKYDIVCDRVYSLKIVLFFFFYFVGQLYFDLTNFELS